MSCRYKKQTGGRGPFTPRTFSGFIYRSTTDLNKNLFQHDIMNEIYKYQIPNREFIVCPDCEFQQESSELVIEHMLTKHKEKTFDLREERSRRHQDRLRAYYVQNPPKRQSGRCSIFVSMSTLTRLIQIIQTLSSNHILNYPDQCFPHLLHIVKERFEESK